MSTPRQSHQENLDQQWMATLAAAKSHHRVMSEMQSSSQGGSQDRNPVNLGETYVSRRTADFPVEWVVVESDDDRRRVVLLDSHPLAGSRDLRLPPDVLGSPMIARCDWSAWLSAKDLETNFRTGVLPPALVRQIQQKQESAAGINENCSLTEREIDHDPEYLLWLDHTLRPAVKALLNGPMPTRKKTAANDNHHQRRWATIAAILIGLLSLPILWQVQKLNLALDSERARAALWEGQATEKAEQLEQEETLRQAKEQEINVLQGEVKSLRESVDTVVAQQTRNLRDQLARAQARLQQTLGNTGTVINPLRIVIDHRSRHGSTRSLDAVSLGAAPLVVLDVEVIDPEPYKSYEVRLSPENGKPLRFEDLKIQDGKWLRVVLPANLLEPDDYSIVIIGFGMGEPAELGERYDVRIEG